MNESYNNVKEFGGYKFLNDLKLIKVTGKDSSEYINTQTCNNVLEIKEGNGIYNALLDRKAHLKAVFTIHKINHTLCLFLETNQANTLMKHLEQFHFTEDFEQEDLSENYKFVSVLGDLSDKLIFELFDIDTKSMEINDILLPKNNFDILLVSKNEFLEKEFLIAISNEYFNDIKNKILSFSQENNFIEISDTVMETLRIESGIPKYNLDMDDKNLISETGLENYAVSYTKGCYLGQEVVARIKTYGTAPKALIGLIFEDKLPPFNSEILINTKNIGIIKSGIYSPFIKKNISLAYLHKDYRTPDEILEFEIGNIIYKAKIILLPFYKKLSKDELASQLYEKALVVFAENKEEEAIELLKKAIKYKPDFPDAYESLGVILSRLEKFEDAIDIMNKLTEIAPDEPMARTNLSIFYMKIGNKEEAEKQMAQATTLKFKKAMHESKAKKSLVEQKQKELQAIRDRMEMFLEVLETEDKDDLIANYGMGKSHFDLQEYDLGIPYFNKAIQEKKDYSMAYLYLGKSLEFTDKKEEALETYKKGILVSAQKGDLMPLKEMEQRKLVLER